MEPILEIQKDDSLQNIRSLSTVEINKKAQFKGLSDLQRSKSKEYRRMTGNQQYNNFVFKETAIFKIDEGQNENSDDGETENQTRHLDIIKFDKKSENLDED